VAQHAMRREADLAARREASKHTRDNMWKILTTTHREDTDTLANAEAQARKRLGELRTASSEAATNAAKLRTAHAAAEAKRCEPLAIGTQPAGQQTTTVGAPTTAQSLARATASRPPAGPAGNGTPMAEHVVIPASPTSGPCDDDVLYQALRDGYPATPAMAAQGFRPLAPGQHAIDTPTVDRELYNEPPTPVAGWDLLLGNVPVAATVMLTNRTSPTPGHRIPKQLGTQLMGRQEDASQRGRQDKGVALRAEKRDGTLDLKRTGTPTPPPSRPATPEQPT